MIFYYQSTFCLSRNYPEVWRELDLILSVGKRETGALINQESFVCHDCSQSSAASWNKTSIFWRLTKVTSNQEMSEGFQGFLHQHQSFLVLLFITKELSTVKTRYWFPLLGNNLLKIYFDSDSAVSVRTRQWKREIQTRISLNWQLTYFLW